MCQELGLAWHRDLTGLRALARSLALQEEVVSTSQELQVLQGTQEQSQGVRQGLNPLAGLGQLAYLKGYFLLHYLQEKCGGRGPFLRLLTSYIDLYSGKLVNSSHFKELYFATFPHLQEVEQEVQSWLLTPGLPRQVNNLEVLDMAKKSLLHREVMDHYAEIIHLNSKKRGKKSKTEFVLEPLEYTEQLCLLFSLVLQMSNIRLDLLKLLKTRYGERIHANPDLTHQWCEAVVRWRMRGEYDVVGGFLEHHQAMGVYLYAEMLLSR